MHRLLVCLLVTKTVAVAAAAGSPEYLKGPKHGFTQKESYGSWFKSQCRQCVRNHTHYKRYLLTALKFCFSGNLSELSSSLVFRVRRPDRDQRSFVLVRNFRSRQPPAAAGKRLSHAHVQVTERPGEVERALCCSRERSP